jgi:hypothetical protein
VSSGTVARVGGAHLFASLQNTSVSAPSPTNPITAILDAFRTHDVVALSDPHGLKVPGCRWPHEGDGMSTFLVWLAVALLAQSSASADHPFAGHWTADLAASRFNGPVVVKAASLEFVVTSETVAITHRTIDSSDRDVGTGTTTLRIDGESHPHDELLPGLTVVARWRGPRLLDTVLTRRNGIVDHVTYEISDDGRTLTTKTAGSLGTQEIVFRRD